MKNKEKMLKYFLIICLCLFSACVKNQYHGITPEASSGKLSLFESVTSCTPTLSWSPQLDPNITYDVQVNVALLGKGSPPEKGEIIFYKEMIPTNSVQITTPLKPNNYYLWSVRTRKVTGEVGSWSNYNKSTDTFITQEVYRNLWFGIETPEICSDISSVENTQSSPEAAINGKDSYITGRQLTDAYIKELLGKGWGGIILRNKAYTYKGDFNKEKYSNVQQWIRQEGKEYSYNNINIFWLAKGHEDEMPSYGNDGFFVMILPPGEYVLSRVVSRDYSGTKSIRVFKDVNVEKGKIVFLGDVISLIKKNLVGQARIAEPFIVFDEVGFKEVKSKYPLTSSFISQ
ncbi:MAG: hypothetical protein IPJ69_00290 [Deltaproteobacteria bacterium]|nr:MAG: hypothetical protein IPJ69_00290 [Deltaproteobacteria bacterium]